MDRHSTSDFVCSRRIHVAHVCVGLLLLCREFCFPNRPSLETFLRGIAENCIAFDAFSPHRKALAPNNRKTFPWKNVVFTEKRLHKCACQDVETGINRIVKKEKEHFGRIMVKLIRYLKVIISSVGFFFFPFKKKENYCTRI